MGVTVLFTGNPGIGKSTIFNTAIGSIKSKSGYSHNGTGVTKENSVFAKNSCTYTDTPGVDDMAGRENGLRGIQDAIRNSSSLKLFLVVKTEAGRFRLQDITLAKLILDSLKSCGMKTENKYSIIFNFCSKRFMKDIKNEEVRTIMLKPFQEVSPTTSILMLRTEEDADDEDDVLLKRQSQDIKDFVENAPIMHSDNFVNFTVLEEWPKHWALEKLNEMIKNLLKFWSEVKNI